MSSECEGNCFMTKAEESGLRSRLLHNPVSGKAGNDTGFFNRRSTPELCYSSTPWHFARSLARVRRSA